MRAGMLAVCICMCTCAGLGTGVLWVSRQVVEEVVGELNGGQLWHLEEATGNVCDLVVGGIEICQTVGEQGRGEREGGREGGRVGEEEKEGERR